MSHGRSLWRIAALTLSILLCMSVSVSAMTFTVIDPPGLSSRGGFTQATGINNAGQIVGFYRVGNGPGDNTLSFVRTGGSYSTFAAPGTSIVTTQARSINDGGQIAGFYADLELGSNGFVKDGATFTDIAPPDASQTLAIGINGAGDVVGYSFSASGFLKSGGTYSTISVPGSQMTYPLGINNSGVIVGAFDDATGARHAFLKAGDTFDAFDIPGLRNTIAYGINNLGQIVGSGQNAAGFFQGFLKDGATITVFDAPGSDRQTEAFGINDYGQIVGYFVGASDHRYHGYVTGGTPDTTPPVVTVSATPSVLWPVDHKLVQIAVSVVAIDDRDPHPVTQLVSVTSSEPANGKGDGNTQPDIVVQNGIIYLRAERSGNANDRVYTITYRATDAAGNTGFGSTTVTVPHDKR